MVLVLQTSNIIDSTKENIKKKKEKFKTYPVSPSSMLREHWSGISSFLDLGQLESCKHSEKIKTKANSSTK